MIRTLEMQPALSASDAIKMCTTMIIRIHFVAVAAQICGRCKMDLTKDEAYSLAEFIDMQLLN